ncbi:MAG: hypothetical protein KDE03_14705 [Rhodobacteraceae bacterium]|nr:hypothetical protein [Paracoccaceae bacterium]
MSGLFHNRPTVAEIRALKGRRRLSMMLLDAGAGRRAGADPAPEHMVLVSDDGLHAGMAGLD